MGRLSMSFIIWLVIAMAAKAQDDEEDDVVVEYSSVLDTSRRPLVRGVKYLIKPALLTHIGGPLTMIDLNGSGSCPFYVGQGNVSGSNEIPVTFNPMVDGENLVRERKNLKVAFSAARRTCTIWKMGQQDPLIRRSLIETTGESSSDGGKWSSYFVIVRDQRLGGNIYNLEFCPICGFGYCGRLECLVEKGKRLVALGVEGFALPLVFERV